ncbi:MAG: two-component system phosphate regulon sensor histidine kinase PhoR [Bacteroidia bacterium]|jgi:two-component system phosphate regulon sensor histidine kinase PhoR
MKFKLLFIFIIIYILVSFGWLTYSLVNFSNKEYGLQRQVLEAGRQACVLRLIEKSKNYDFSSDESVHIIFKQAKIDADTNLLNAFLETYNYGSYRAVYTKVFQSWDLDIQIAPHQMDRLETKLRNRERLYIFQALLLFILVAVGVYGVYYSIQMIYNLNKQQNNFLLSVTHELKTPIATMKLLLQTIRSRNLPEPKRNELLDKAVNNVDRLNELTENMLTAMQIENDNYIYGKEEFSITDMMKNLADSYQMRTDLTVDIEDDVDIVGDRFILRISMNNLLENAIKYGNDLPIEVTLKATKNKAIIEVKDQGIGIDESERKKIFKKFYRVEDEEVRDTKGTGLGLFIVRETIEKHNGAIRIKDNEPNGTIFIIELPLSGKNE